MPNWEEVLREIEQEKVESPLDRIRRKYLKKLSEKTGRNVITYYSGWLTAPYNSPMQSINDADMNSIMSSVHGLDRSKGLDLILHTPGGDLAATEAIVSYMRKMFGTDIHAYIPQLAMSAGTMIACSCKKIYMGKESSLGPIDPQMNGLPAGGVIAEFNKAVQEIQAHPERLPIWQTIIGKYHPTFLGECQNAIQWGKDIVSQWLTTGMFEGVNGADQTIANILQTFGDHGQSLNHSRHFDIDHCKNSGLIIESIEDDEELQDLVLTVHHAYMHTFSMTGVLKIVENQNGSATVYQPPSPPR